MERFPVWRPNNQYLLQFANAEGQQLTATVVSESKKTSDLEEVVHSLEKVLGEKDKEI